MVFPPYYFTKQATLPKTSWGGNLKLCKLTWRNRIGYPAQPGLIRSSVRPSVHACRLGIERKIAQVQQIQSIILQNHESTRNVNQKFFKKKYMSKRNTVNNMKLFILEIIRVIHTCSFSPRAAIVLVIDGGL